jgi:CHASE3 domain sensor protein
MADLWLHRKVPLACGSALLALLVVGAISCGGMIVSAESGRRVRSTYEVIETLRGLRSAVQYAKSSYRPNVLIGKDSNFDSCLAHIPTDWNFSAHWP